MIGESVCHWLGDDIIEVKDAEKWEYDGQIVMGLCWGDFIQVDSRMMALAHELLESAAMGWHQQESYLAHQFHLISDEYIVKQRRCLNEYSPAP